MNIEIANVQGIGNRTEQQDAFGASRISDYGTDGILLTVCDGMGGMSSGGVIARDVLSKIMEVFPWKEDFDVPGYLTSISNNVYENFYGQGGTTVVMIHLKENKLKFWSIGDSDILLLRDGVLSALNIRHEYSNELIIKALELGFPAADAFSDPQAAALSNYIGKRNPVCETNRLLLELKDGDTLLLCSDGISDTLSFDQIAADLMLPVDEAASQMEEEIISANLENQDNYTGIILRYIGSR
jgi:protein phosphatase